MEEGGELSARVPYDDFIDSSFAKHSVSENE